MKMIERSTGYLARFALIVTAAGSVVTAGMAAPGSIQWEKDLPSALKAAGTANKIVMVDFYTDWCGYCKELDRVTYKDKRVVAESANFVNLKIDAEAQPDTAGKYQVRGYPTILFMDAHGGEITRIGGYQPPADFLDSMQEAKRMQTEFLQSVEQAQAHPDDISANATLSLAYYQRRNLENGKRHLDAAVKLDTNNASGRLPELYLRAGIANGMSGELKQAIHLLSEGLEKFPNSSVADETRYYLGLSYLFDEQKESASNTLKEVVASAKSEGIRNAAQERLNELGGNE